MGLPREFRRPSPPVTDAVPYVGNPYGRVSNIRNDILGFGTEDDPLEFTTWQPPRLLVREEIESAVLGCGEARMLVAAVPRDGCAVGFKITDPTKAVKPLSRIIRRSFMVREMKRAAILGNTYGETFLFPVVREYGAVVPPERLGEPLDVNAVTGLDRFEVILGGIGREATPDQSSRQRSAAGPYQYGQPTRYQVNMARAGVTFTANIHASRLLKFSGDWYSPRATLSTGQYQQGESISVLQAVIVELFNWRETGNACRRAAQQVSEKVLHTPYIFAPDAPDEYQQAYFRRWSSLKLGSHLRTTILGMNADGSAMETLDRLNFPVEGLEKLNDAALSHLASAKGWPKEILGGLQPTGIINSGPSWEPGWWKVVGEWREGDYRTALETVVPLLYMAEQGSVPAEWDLEFEPLGQLTQVDAANVAKTEAETVAVYHDLGAVGGDQVRRSKFGPESTPPAGIQPATEEEMNAATQANTLPLAVRSDPVARATATKGAPTPSAAKEPEDAEVASPDNAVAYAAQLTEHQSAHCRFHPKMINRCRLCGVERVRELGPDGMPLIKWRSMSAPTAADTTDRGVCVALLPTPSMALDKLIADVLAILPGARPIPWPHVTLLWAGPLDGADEDVVQGAARALATRAPMTLHGRSVTPLGAEGAVVLTLRGAGVADVATGLLRACAGMRLAPQHHPYLPHLTICHVDQINDEQMDALSEVAVPPEIVCAELVVRRGDVEVLRVGLKG